MLGEENFKPSSRDEVIGLLRTCVALGPQMAGRVRDALVRLHGNDKGGDLYRMLWGYSNDTLMTGDDAKLVGYLDHEMLEYRVLAYWNLNHITGLTLLYRPEYPADKRASGVKRWQDKLGEGVIRVREG